MSVLLLALGMVVFVLKSTNLYPEISNLKPELPHPAPAVQMPKLLPEERVKSLFTYNGIWLFPKNQCHCEASRQQEHYVFEDAYSQKDLPAVKMRRQAEFEHFQRREGLPRPPPLLAQPNLPFGYPVHGVEVMPLHTVPIPVTELPGRDCIDLQHLYKTEGGHQRP